MRNEKGITQVVPISQSTEFLVLVHEVTHRIRYQCLSLSHVGQVDNHFRRS